ncbi:WD40-repeat-containing domain protein [Schizophyllum amplum]|uniref:WD40-repeat-containing domain protein n=1 Tax=Schizophyllum amplum TaxID=97359 RepID=A0A550C1Y2_9AGAR|nr:WD40-repeat-containing domain protein [Auriculariopsis ampla]
MGALSKTAERPNKKARIAPEKAPKASKSRAKASPSSKSAALAKPAPTREQERLPSSKAKGKAKAKTTDEPEPLPTSFKVVAGSYEKLLYGLEGTVSSDPESSRTTFTLKPIFIFPAHVSCIKAVAASPHGGKWLASGSSDEIIKVWDLRRRKEIGGLMHHEGSITQLDFPSRSHLLSASEDGTLCLFRSRDWVVLRALRGHKGRVNSVAAHPSGKVALSVGKDRTLRMWDLMRGKGRASTKLPKEGEVVRWSMDGKLFIVQSGSTIDVYTLEMSLIHTITHPSRVHDVRFCKRVNGEGEVLLVGAEDKLLSVYAVSTDPDVRPTMVAKMTGHANRVKSFQTLSIALPDGTPTTVVCTVSSDGRLNAYNLGELPAASASTIVELEPAGTYDSKGTRFTCVTVADGDVEVAKLLVSKRKRTEEHLESGEESEDKEDDEDGEEWAPIANTQEGVSEGEEEEEEEEGEEEMESD